MGRTIYTPEHQMLASLLREVRDESGLRQVDVAAAMERSQSFVSDYESGQRRLDIVELRALCTVLGTTLPALVDRYESIIRSYKAERGPDEAQSPKTARNVRRSD